MIRERLSNLDEYKTFGNFDAPSGDNLVIAFEMCTPEKSQVPCKSEEEVREWMFYKYIAIFINQKLFISHKFGPESVNAQAELKWYPLNIGSRSDYVLQLHRNQMDMHDSLIDLGSISMDSQGGYEIEWLPTREMMYTEPF